MDAFFNDQPSSNTWRSFGGSGGVSQVNTDTYKLNQIFMKYKGWFGLKFIFFILISFVHHFHHFHYRSFLFFMKEN